MSLAFQNWGSTIFWLHHFKPLLSFVPKAIFIIYTPMIFLFPFVWEKFFNLSNSTDQISLLFICLLSRCEITDRKCHAFDKNFNQNRIQDSHNTAKRKYWSFQLCVYVRWRLHVRVCSMYIWSNCSCCLNVFLYVLCLCYAKLRCLTCPTLTTAWSAIYARVLLFIMSNMIWSYIWINKFLIISCQVYGTGFWMLDWCKNLLVMF